MRVEYKGTYMYDQDKDSPFKNKIRIKPAQLEWIRQHKGKYTLAGKLDEIINFYKNENNRPYSL